jgi:hypothetical protein
MLVSKDEEIFKLKDSKKKQCASEEVKGNENNSGIESDSSDEHLKQNTGTIAREDKHNVDSTSRAYLKNVLMKYLEYQANGQEKESMTMEKVLFTVLKVQEQDVSTL